MSACSGPSSSMKPGGHRDHPALPHPVGEQLAVLDELAHRRQGQAEPLGDVGDGQPRRRRGPRGRQRGRVRHPAVRRSREHRVPQGPGHAERPAGRERPADRRHSGTVCPKGLSNHTRHSCHRQGSAMVISAPPAIVPPVALQPGLPGRGVEPGAARLDQLQGPARRHPHRHRRTLPHDGRRDRRAQPRPQPAPDPRRQRAQRAAHPAAKSSASRVAGRRPRVHVVRSGDTLSGIAARYHVTLPRPAQGQPPLGRARSSTRASGSSCAGRRVHGRRGPHHTAATTAYRVRAGDTLGAIAAAPPHLRGRHRPGQRHLAAAP